MHMGVYIYSRLHCKRRTHTTDRTAERRINPLRTSSSSNWMRSFLNPTPPHPFCLRKSSGNWIVCLRKTKYGIIYYYIMRIIRLHVKRYVIYYINIVLKWILLFKILQKCFFYVQRHFQIYVQCTHSINYTRETSQEIQFPRKNVIGMSK